MRKRKLRSSLLVIAGGVGASVAIGFVVLRECGAEFSISPKTAHTLPEPYVGEIGHGVKESIAHLRSLVDKDPENSRVVFKLAQLLQDSHSLHEAAKYYALGLKTDSLNNVARVDYALCLYEIGKTGDALDHSRIVLRNDPIHVEALFNVGAIFANNANRDSAEIYWSKLISNHPDHELAARAMENLRLLAGGSTFL